MIRHIIITKLGLMTYNFIVEIAVKKQANKSVDEARILKSFIDFIT